jgi:hypothetical protein
MRRNEAKHITRSRGPEGCGREAPLLSLALS